MVKKIVIATTKSWNIDRAYHYAATSAHEVYVVTEPSVLTPDFIIGINPDYIFFPHWSWIIPASIFSVYECIVFHMTDVPFGRGGSPLQNLISHKIYDTKISALRVVQELDAGDVYLKVPFSLRTGSAQELYEQASQIIFEQMMPKIIERSLQPVAQQGLITTYKRRKPEQSNMALLHGPSVNDVYDIIRMLDAPGYPPAYLKLGNLTIRFSRAQLHDSSVTAQVEITTDDHPLT